MPVSKCLVYLYFPPFLLRAVMLEWILESLKKIRKDASKKRKMKKNCSQAVEAKRIKKGVSRS